ncbi:MAG: Vitamin B12 dependent methionine synthase activation subunit [Ruminococcaceae bacterium]|nr:Vitamin B12 dependent methionine synthase activation subunit [Oscillospiraceae bacterium]
MSFSLHIQRFETDTLFYRQSHVLRYLGYGEGQADSTVLSQLKAAYAELCRYAEPRAVYSRLPLSSPEADTLLIGSLEWHSRDLCRCLSDCREVLVLAATLGAGVDRLIARTSVLSPATAVITDALASDMIECVCDRLCQTFSEDGMRLRPRYSPGYGDLPLSVQGELLSLLSAPTRIGLSVNHASMMTPTKSVSAIVGILPS